MPKLDKRTILIRAVAVMIAVSMLSTMFYSFF